MLRVRLITDPFNLADYSEHLPLHCGLLRFLQDELGVWPDTARLYRDQITVGNDITPRTEDEAQAIADTRDGLFYVVVYPGDPVTAIIAVVATLALTAAVLLFLTPKIPNAPSQDESSNNSLGARSNKPRPNGRIEDIFGTVVSVPTMLALPLSVYEGNVEVELCYMAVGRGDYVISQVQDGDTPISQIAGAGVRFYGPNTRPGNGTPTLAIGTAITQPLLDVVKQNEVNGQSLRAPNANAVQGAGDIRFVAPDQIQRQGSVIDFSKFFGAGDQLTVQGASDGLDGVYPILAVTAGTITLGNPVAINAAWGTFSSPSAYGSPSLSTQGVRYAGPFIVQMLTATQFIGNVVAPQGMYRVTTKGKNRPASVTVEFAIQQASPTGVAFGDVYTYQLTIAGDGTDKRAKAATLYAALPFVGSFSVKVRRVTPNDQNTEDTIADEVQWRDGYGTAEVTVPHFGDVTTVHTRTYATASASSTKERKLNCMATRKVLVRNPDNTFGPALAPSNNAAAIICHMALDPYIGGRLLRELDVDQLFATVAEVAQYFGVQEAGHFNYTFDQDNISFEEMVQTVAQAVFCTAYRQGSVLRLFFEEPFADSVMLFNHRNKIPDTEVRTVRLGNLNNYDGVELDYVSADDGSKLTVYVPEDQSAVKPKKIEILGVIDTRGDAAVPTLHAKRAYNKIRYQHTTTEFTALGEASQLVRNQKIDVADNTRPDVFDGQVDDIEGLVLTLSQPFVPEDGLTYSIFLQLESGIVERIPCVAGADEMHIVLQAAPSQELVVNADAYVHTLYTITANVDNARDTGFLLTEKGPFDKGQVSVQAINYDPRYYKDDQSFRSDLLLADDNGFLIDDNGTLQGGD